MQTLIAVPTLAQAFLLLPRAARLAAVAITLVTGLLLGPDGVDAKGIITGGR
jgi:hypothetical protein